MSTSGGNTAVDAAGYRWNGNGSLTVSAIPVFYSGATLGTVNAALKRAGEKYAAFVDARRMGHDPRVAFLSFSTFGNPMGLRSEKVREAVRVQHVESRHDRLEKFHRGAQGVGTRACAALGLQDGVEGAPLKPVERHERNPLAVARDRKSTRLNSSHRT